MQIVLTFIVAFVLVSAGCTYTKPERVKPVEHFKLTKYLGTWYEIARLEHKFEKGMESISATYRMREDGGIDVRNRGYKTAEKVWHEAKGKAYFVEGTDKGFLKVSFFGPFYGSYIVIDTDYITYTMISGPDLSYFWILSRTPTLDKKILNRLLSQANALGFDTDALIYPKQGQVKVMNHETE